MSTDIKLTADLGGNQNGDVITVTDGVAAQLIENEYAEATESKPKRGRSKASEPSESAPKTGVAGASPADPSSTAG